MKRPRLLLPPAGIKRKALRDLPMAMPEVCYWYDDHVRQGLTGRGKEIYDPATNSWYWMDSLEDGKIAINKDVYQPYGSRLRTVPESGCATNILAVCKRDRCTLP